jgi:hypothetical protein
VFHIFNWIISLFFSKRYFCSSSKKKKKDIFANFLKWNVSQSCESVHMSINNKWIISYFELSRFTQYFYNIFLILFSYLFQKSIQVKHFTTSKNINFSQSLISNHLLLPFTISTMLDIYFQVEKLWVTEIYILCTSGCDILGFSIGKIETWRKDCSLSPPLRNCGFFSIQHLKINCWLINNQRIICWVF